MARGPPSGAGSNVASGAGRRAGRRCACALPWGFLLGVKTVTPLGLGRTTVVRRSRRFAATQSTLMLKDVLTRFDRRGPSPRTHRGAGGDAGGARGPGRRKRSRSIKSTRFCEPGTRISSRAGVRAGLGPADRDDGRYGPPFPGCREYSDQERRPVPHRGGPASTATGPRIDPGPSPRPPIGPGGREGIDSRHPYPATEIRVHPLECEACFAGPAIGFQVSSPTGRCDICGSTIERRFRVGARLPLAGMIVRSSVTTVARLDGRPGRGRRDDASRASASKDPRPARSLPGLHSTRQHSIASAARLFNRNLPADRDSRIPVDRPCRPAMAAIVGKPIQELLATGQM